MTARELYNAIGKAFADGLDYGANVDMLCPAWGYEHVAEISVEDGGITLIPEAEAKSRKS